MTTYIVEHNNAFNSIGHLVQSIEAVAAVAEKLTCNRTKCTVLVNNATGKYAFQAILRTIKNSKNKFSVLVGERTDQALNI